MSIRPAAPALASDLIWRELQQLDCTKPVVIYMGDVAASGGYYIAAPGAKLWPNVPRSPARSGRDHGEGCDCRRLRSWMPDTVQRGAHADLYSSLTAWKANSGRRLKGAWITSTAKSRSASTGRNLPLERLDDLAGGRAVDGVNRRLPTAWWTNWATSTWRCKLPAPPPACPPTGSVPLAPISAPGRFLLAEPVQAAQALLGLFTRGPGAAAGGSIAEGEGVRVRVRG